LNEAIENRFEDNSEYELARRPGRSSFTSPEGGGEKNIQNVNKERER